MKTLAEAAAAYCQRRAEIDAIAPRLEALGPCTPDWNPEPVGRTYLKTCEPEWRDVRRCFERVMVNHGSPDMEDEPCPWFELTPPEEALLCPVCRSRCRLFSLRHKLRAGLAGLMRSMRSAYRREAAK